MGNCFSTPEPQLPDTDVGVAENDWESNSVGGEADDGTTASTSSTERKGDSGDMSPRQTISERHSETQNDSANRKVRFHTETPEKNVLREIFSEESLLEKRRKSFSADLRIFAELIFEDSEKTSKEGKNSN